ncbi:MAG: hypothetical protein IH840_02390 [Candidatus Heimdallarchaeota archaeon]|nr:hypothetical protein [Candidatus Heimdallarchaeota archaeon]
MPGRYTIYLDGINQTSGTWSNGENITLNFASLTLGVYNLTIAIFDLTLNVIYETIIFTILDVVSPGINTPLDSGYEQGTTGNVIIWIGTDNNPGTFEVELEGSSYLNGTWSNGGDIVISIDNLGYGSYTFNLILNDSSGNQVSHSVLITVVDTTLPVVQPISDISYSEGSVNNSISLNATDLNPSSYEISIDGLFNFSASWASDGVINHNIDGLTKGVYNFSILFIDQLGNQFEIWLLVTVLDNTQPVITSPADYQYNEGDTNNRLIWVANDINPLNYTIYLDNETYSEDFWTSGTNITINIDDLTRGQYNFTILVRDEAGNQNADTILVVVVDWTAPVFQEMEIDITFSEDTGGNTLSWLVNDSYEYTYDIYENQVLVQSANWTTGSSIVFLLDHLRKGVHNITITIYDQSLNQLTQTVTITVLDATSTIIITDSPDIVVIEGSEQRDKLNWTLTDNYGFNYTIYLNGINVQSGTWGVNQTELIDTDLDLLLKGIYNYTIVVYDQSANRANYTVLVYVVDEDIPELDPVTMPIDYSYAEGILNNEISWTAIDNYADYYIIYQNELSWKNGTWFSGTPIIIDIDGLLKGTYNFTIILFDESLNYITNTVFIQVTDEIQPEFLSIPEDFEFDEGTFGNDIVWEIFEAYPKNYQIIINDIVELDAIWANSTHIIYNPDHLEEGRYNITIVIFDQSGNPNTDSLILIILDITPPQILDAPSEWSHFYESVGNDLIFYVTDRHPNTYVIELDGNLVASSIWSSDGPILYNLDQLTVGEYNLTIFISDVTGNESIWSIIIKVKDRLIIETFTPIINIINEVYEGDFETIEGIWVDINGSGVQNGEVEVWLEDAGLHIEIAGTRNSLKTNDDGQYQLHLNYTNLESGFYIWVVQFIKDPYQAQSLELELKILPHDYVIELQVLPDLVEGEEYFITVIVYYANRSVDNSSLRLNEYIVKDGRAESIIVQIEVAVEYSDGQAPIYTLQGLSGENGVVAFSLSPAQTQNLLAIKGISATILSTDFGNEVTLKLGDEALPDIQRDSGNTFTPLIQQFGDVVGIIIAFLVFLLGILVISFVINHRRTNMYRRLLEAANFGKSELNDIMNIQAIIIMTKSGIPQFDRRFGDFNVDSVLVAGFSTAISSFFNEFVQESNIGIETIERSGLSITSFREERHSVLIISHRSINEIVMSQIKTVQDLLEANYYSTATTRDLMTMLDPDKLYKYFNQADFKIDLKENLVINERNIRSLRKAKTISKYIRDNIGSLTTLANSTISVNKTVSLDQIVEHFKARQMNADAIGKSVILSYKHGIIRAAKLQDH